MPHQKPLYMKTNLFISCATICLIVVYMLTLQIHPDKYGDMSRFIPSTAILYLEQRNGSEAWRKIAGSRFGKKVEAIDYVDIAKELGFKKETVAVIKDALDNYSTAKNDPILKFILGKKFAFALLQPINENTEFSVTEFLQANSVFVIEPKYPAEWLEFTVMHYSQTNTDAHFISSQYGNHQIKKLFINNHFFSIAALDGYLIVSQNEKQLRRCIDAYDTELPALANSSDLREIRKIMIGPDRLFYIPVNNFRDFVISLFKTKQFTGKELLLKELQTTIGFAGFGYGSWTKQTKIVDKIVVRFNPPEINKYARSHVKTPPIENSMLSLVTRDPMVYYWSNTLNFKHFLMYIEERAQQDSQLADFLNRLESITGKSASKTFTLLNEEVSMVVEPGLQDDIFAFPLGVVFVQVQNNDELRTILGKLLETYNVQMREEQYGPAQYRYWSLSPQDGLQPLYGFWDDLFFFGNSASILHKVVDTNLSGFSLYDINLVPKIDPGLKRKNNSAIYFNNIHTIKLIKNFFQVFGTFAAIEDRETARKTRVIIKKVINPLLDGMMMYNASISRSHFTQNMVIIDSMTNTTDNPKISKE